MKPTGEQFMRLQKYSPGMVFFWRDGDDYLVLGAHARLFAAVLDQKTESVNLEGDSNVIALRIKAEHLIAILGDLKRNNFGLVVQVIEDE